ASAERQPELVSLKPEAVVGHETEKVLRRPVGGAALAAHSAAVFTAVIKCEREGGLAERLIRLLVVLDLDAVVGMEALAARIAHCVLANVIVDAERAFVIRPPQNLSANARRLVELAVRLPAVDEPWFDLQLLARKDLRPHAGEEPGRVGRNEGWLVGPVVEVVEAPETDVRQEDSRVNVDPIHLVNVVSAIRLGRVAVGIVEIPLAASGAGIIARLRLRIHAELR